MKDVNKSYILKIIDSEIDSKLECLKKIIDYYSNIIEGENISEDLKKRVIKKMNKLSKDLKNV